MAKRPSSDMATFRKVVAKSKHIIVITGAGISAESGIPTFRGEGGLWRTFQAQDLATPGAFYRNPSLVWEFYHHRREVVFTKEPNKGHVALAEAEARLNAEGKKLVIITQNIDGLHQAAGSKDVTELHGSLFKTECTNCGDVLVNRDSPICESLRGKGAPTASTADAAIPKNQLPTCLKCSGLLRPHVIWFGEGLDSTVLEKADYELGKCDLCLVVGTSSVVYPAAMFAPRVASRGVPVAEFNIECTPHTDDFGYHFEGPSGVTLPQALSQ